MKQDTQAKNFSWLDVPKSIWYFLAEDRKRFVFYLITLTCVFAYSLVPPYIAGKIIDFFTNYSIEQSLKPFYLLVAFLGLTYVFFAVVRLYSKQEISIAGQKARARARIWGFERLTEFSLEWHSKENSGNKIQRVFTGADSIKQVTRLLNRDVIRFTVEIIGFTTIFAFADVKLAILIPMYTAIFFIVEFLFARKIYILTNEFNKINQSASGVYVESTNNMLAIKALGGTSGVTSRVTNTEHKSRDNSIERERLVARKWMSFQFVNGIALVTFFLFIGDGVLEKTITLGMVLIFFTYFTRLREALGDVSDLHSDFLEIRSNLGNMMPIFRETDFIKRGNETFPKDWKNIEIKNASMDYGSGQMGLNNFNLTLNRNTKTGIAGLSGSGKSTLAKIILGLYALKKGSFKIGAKDYYSIAHNETLNNITVVLQETELFNLSLRENITMMREGDAKLLDMAIEISNLEEVVNRLPEGLDALIGEKGYMLSGGERQRLGIARAIYKNAPIVILDEATSSLDSETEGKIMKNLLGKYGEDKTFLIIAHRLSTLKYADNIAVMERGQVVEEGSYDELMEDSGSVFHRMNTVRGREGSQRASTSNGMNKEKKSENDKFQRTSTLV